MIYLKLIIIINGKSKIGKKMSKEAKKVIEALKYHEKHCPETGCVICNTIDNMKIKMRNTNERTRPELCW